MFIVRGCSTFAIVGTTKCYSQVRSSAQAACVLRWSGLISVAAQRALAATFLELPFQSELGAAGPPPALHELLADAR